MGKLGRQTIKALRQIVGEKHLTTSDEDLICYSYDATGEEYLPEAVIFPASSAEISEIMRLASRECFPLVARGAGSGFVGASLPIKGGLVLSTKRLASIIEINRENMFAVVEPGVITGHLQHDVEAVGLFYPPDPSSFKFCTIGGNVAMGAGGPRAVKYGVTRDYVMALEVVLPTGEIITTGPQTAKGVVGYDLTRLMVGSEGTLGIISKITLKLLPRPESKFTIYAEFKGAVEAGRAVTSIMKSGVIPSILEFIDKSALTCIKDYLKAPLKEDTGAILLIEIDGSKSSVAEESDKVEGMLRDLEAIEIKKTDDDKEAASLWDARRAISPALYKLGNKKINEDVVVQRDKIPELIETLEMIADKYELIIANFGHAGDGNIHVNIMINEENPDEEMRAEKAVKEIFRSVLEFNGTISGEHGVGISKQPYISMELSAREIELMKGIKKVFDPSNCLNPGKIFP